MNIIRISHFNVERFDVKQEVWNVFSNYAAFEFLVTNWTFLAYHNAPVMHKNIELKIRTFLSGPYSFKISCAISNIY